MRLCTALPVDDDGVARYLVENVEAFQSRGEAPFQPRAGKGGVPHEVIGVHGRLAIPAAGEHLQVG